MPLRYKTQLLLVLVACLAPFEGVRGTSLGLGGLYGIGSKIWRRQAVHTRKETVYTSNQVAFLMMQVLFMVPECMHELELEKSNNACKPNRKGRSQPTSSHKRRWTTSGPLQTLQPCGSSDFTWTQPIGAEVARRSSFTSAAKVSEVCNQWLNRASIEISTSVAWAIAGTAGPPSDGMFMGELAKEHSAMMVVLEHRYYGIQFPPR